MGIMTTKKTIYYALTTNNCIQYELITGRLEIYEKLADARRFKTSSNEVVEIEVKKTGVKL